MPRLTPHDVERFGLHPDEVSGQRLCTYCDALYEAGEYFTHVRTSPSHMTERDARILDKQLRAEREFYASR